VLGPEDEWVAPAKLHYWLDAFTLPNDLDDPEPLAGIDPNRSVALSLVSLTREDRILVAGAPARGGTDDELVKVIDWLAQVEDGDPRVLFETALRVRDGDGLLRNACAAIVRNACAAIVWLGLAGKRGLVEGYFQAAMIAMGSAPCGFQESDGASFLVRAARAGYGPAQKELGIWFLRGEKTLEPDTAAYIWLLIAARSGEHVGALVGKRLSMAEGKTPRPSR
jgi:hypothetical protein